MRNLLSPKFSKCTTNFGAWLSVAARATRDPAGDLVSDMRTDDELPEFRGLDHMLSYLKRKSACWGAMEAAPVSWRRYRRWAR